MGTVCLTASTVQWVQVAGVGGRAVSSSSQSSSTPSSKYGYIWFHKNQDGAGENAKLKATKLQMGGVRLSQHFPQLLF